MGLFLMIFFTCLIVLKWGKDGGGGEEHTARGGRAVAGGTEHQEQLCALSRPA